MNKLLLTGALIICFASIVFCQEDEIIELDLCRRNITSIYHSSDVLKNAPLDILYLNLCDNDLRNIHKNSFQRFYELEYLNLDNNRRLQFNADGSEFLKLDSLTDLQCFRCGVDKIYNRSLQGMPRLKQINLPKNIIEEIEIKAFYANTYLEKIDLRSNKLRRVPREMLTSLARIEWIDLSKNMELAPERNEPFLISTELEKLSCDECGFVTVQEYTFAKLTGLKELYLRRNKVSQIHSMAFFQVTLTTLMLEGNTLKIIDTEILNVQNLTICLDNNTDELECFLKDESKQDKFLCSKTVLHDVECLAPIAIEIFSPSTIDVTNSTTDMTIIPKDGRMLITTTKHPDTFAKNGTLSTSIPSASSLKIVERIEVTNYATDPVMPILHTNLTKTTPKTNTENIQGILDTCIFGHLILICLALIVTFILLVGVWFKLKKKDTTPDSERFTGNIPSQDLIYESVDMLISTEI